MHGRMPLPKEVTFVTFDVYGTLIDSDTGIYEAFSKEAENDGYTISRDELIPLFKETQKEIKGGSYELYAEVLRRTAVQISKQLGWPLEPSRSGFLPDSVKRWPPFKETNTQLDRFKKKFEHRADRQHRRQAARRDPPPLQGRLRPRRHRPAGPLLQARPRALQGVRAPHRRQEGLGPRGVGLLLRRRAVHQGQGPRDLGQPQQGAARLLARRSRPRRSRPSSRRPSCSAPPRRRCAGRRAAPRRRRRHVALLADDLHARALRRGGVLRRLARPPRRARDPAVDRRPGALPRRRAAGHARRLGPPARPLRVPRRAARRRRVDRAAAAQRAGPRAARDARLRRGELHRAPRRRSGCRSRRRCRSRATARSATRSSSCTPPTATPPTAWRSGSRGHRCWCAATTSRRSRSRCSRRAARATPTSRRSTASSRWSSRPRTSSRATARALDAVRAAAILREDRAYLEALPDAPLPLARRTGAQKQIHAANVAALA